MFKHFYFDQGGWVGKPKYKLSDKKLRLSQKEIHISHYYYGYMPTWAISDVLYLFKEKYNQEPKEIE